MSDNVREMTLQEEIKKAVEKELHKGLYPDFLREVKP